MTAPTPGQLAAADQRVAQAEKALGKFVAKFPEVVQAHGGRTQAIAELGAVLEQHLTPFEIQLLAAVSIAQLAERAPAAGFDLFAEDVVPAGPHAVATMTRSQDGTPVAVCVCTALFTGDDEDDAVAALDAHIANPETVPFRIGDLARADIVEWLNAEPRDLVGIHGMAWCSRVTETGGKPSEVELIDGQRLVVDETYGVWVPKVGA